MLSVIIPVYNAERFLPRCLESICKQTYRDLEIICVNDGSVDNSGSMLDEYAARDARVKVIHRENAGVSAARNAGLDAASGELVTFVDADDWVELDAYEKTVPLMIDGVDLVCFGSFVDGEVDAETRAGMEDYQRVRRAGCCPAAEGVPDTDVFVWNKIFRRAVIEKSGVRFPEKIACGEDGAFYFCYAAVAEKACYLPERLYHYVQQGESAMAKFRKRTARGLDHLSVAEMVFGFYTENGRMPKMCHIYDGLFAGLYARTLETTPQELHPEVHARAYALAVRSRAIQNARYGAIRSLRQLHLPAGERLFHWFAENRECFGVFGKSIYSITYEKNQDVHRLLGCVVKTVHMEEHA